MAVENKMSRAQTYQKGHAAESFAAWWLRFKGYRIVARRHKTPVGEVDIIAQRGRMLVAVEVKYRRAMVEAMEAVSHQQRGRIMRAMEYFRAGNPVLAEYTLRYDVMALAPRCWPCHMVHAWEG